MTLQPHELKLASKLLKLADDYFSNRSCNDFDLVSEGELTPEEAHQVNRDYVQWNGDADSWSDEELQSTDAFGGDSGLMRWLAHRFDKEI